MNSKRIIPVFKIVTVEDSMVIRERVQSILEEIDNVTFLGNACTISEALSLVELKQPDMVMLDIHLKGERAGLSGIDLLQILKRKYPGMKVVMLTNLSGPQYRNACLRLGADHFMDKANDFERIPDVLNDIFKQ